MKLRDWLFGTLRRQLAVGVALVHAVMMRSCARGRSLAVVPASKPLSAAMSSTARSIAGPS